jgi:hypothetical protein
MTMRIFKPWNPETKLRDWRCAHRGASCTRPTYLFRHEVGVGGGLSQLGRKTVMSAMGQLRACASQNSPRRMRVEGLGKVDTIHSNQQHEMSQEPAVQATLCGEQCRHCYRSERLPSDNLWHGLRSVQSLAGPSTLGRGLDMGHPGKGTRMLEQATPFSHRLCLTSNKPV